MLRAIAPQVLFVFGFAIRRALFPFRSDLRPRARSRAGAALTRKACPATEGEESLRQDLTWVPHPLRASTKLRRLAEVQCVSGRCRGGGSERITKQAGWRHGKEIKLYPAITFASVFCSKDEKQ